MKWTIEEENFLREHYPEKGRCWCAEQLNRSVDQIRSKSARLMIYQDRNSDFFKDWQKRAADSKIGKKRPDQALVMKRLHEEGKLAMTEEMKKNIGDRTRKYIQEHGHPRGALGMAHTQESKEAISLKSKEAWAKKTPEQLDKHSRMASENGRKVSPINREGASWKAGWREVGGYKKYYRSRWEANYARYLEHLRVNGLIKSWLHEPRTFWFDGIKRGCMSYLPDFEVIENSGRFVYHEVKGWMDDRSKTKIRRMAKYHPDVELIVIGSKEYRELDRKCKPLLEGWE